MNRYLQDRAMRRMDHKRGGRRRDRRDYAMDYRRDRRRSDYGMDERRDRRDDYDMDYRRGSDGNDYGRGHYEVRGQYDSRGDYNDYGGDYRNPYGSRGGYVDSRGRGSSSSRRNLSEHDVRFDSHHGGYMDYRNEDYYDGSDYDYYDKGYMDYASKEEEKMYHEELDKWIKKLESKNKFNLNESQVLDMAKRTGVSMKDYDEKEFYATFLMQVSDYPRSSNDPAMYIEMARDFLEDDDVKVKGGEKLCKYLYTIVLGEDE